VILAAKIDPSAAFGVIAILHDPSSRHDSIDDRSITIHKRWSMNLIN
jgi:hypothetical protein